MAIAAALGVATNLVEAEAAQALRTHATLFAELDHALSGTIASFPVDARTVLLVFWNVRARADASGHVARLAIDTAFDVAAHPIGAMLAGAFGARRAGLAKTLDAVTGSIATERGGVAIAFIFAIFGHEGT